MIKRTVPLWIEKWPAAELQERKTILGSMAFARGYRQEPISDENLLFKSFRTCIRAGAVPDMRDCNHYTGVDPSGKSRAGSVIFTLAVSKDGRRVPVDIRRGAWTPDQTAKQIIEVAAIYKPRVILFEDNALQDGYISLVKQISPDKSIPIKGFTTGRNKHSEREGLPGLEIDFENRSWEIYLDEHEYSCSCPWCTWVGEMTSYPGGENSDCVMACWFAWEAIRLFRGVGVHFVAR